jgi:anti-anti-sigma regulatory factor
MAIEFAYDSARNCLAVRGRFTILHVTEALSQFKAQPAADIDLSGVDEFDAAGLQLLLATKRETGRRLVGISEAVAEVIALTGCSELTEAGT